MRLYHDLTQILRLCLQGPLDPKTVAPGFAQLLARAADVPDFATLDVFLAETEGRVRRVFKEILGAAARCKALGMQLRQLRSSANVLLRWDGRSRRRDD